MTKSDTLCENVYTCLLFIITLCALKWLRQLKPKFQKNVLYIYLVAGWAAADRVIAAHNSQCYILLAAATLREIINIFLCVWMNTELFIPMPCTNRLASGVPDDKDRHLWNFKSWPPMSPLETRSFLATSVSVIWTFFLIVDLETSFRDTKQKKQ